MQVEISEDVLRWARTWLEGFEARDEFNPQYIEDGYEILSTILDAVRAAEREKEWEKCDFAG